MKYFNNILDVIYGKFVNNYMSRPLHFIGLPGIILIFAGFAIMGYFGIQWILTRELHVRPLLLLGGGSIIVGIQFISLGLIGEMIAYLKYLKEKDKPAGLHGVSEIDFLPKAGDRSV